VILQPVDLLINEHSLIIRMINFIKKEAEQISKNGTVKPSNIVIAVDFFRTYADKYHHGKEEAILFKELSQKKLSDLHHAMMLELITEHALSRKTVTSLESANEDYIECKTETLRSILKHLEVLIDLYPKHIEKENNQFFYASMEYLTQKEQEAMLCNFVEFDQNFTTKRYQQIVDSLENQTENKA
jgi:hemerythrin-like domain-containing protein